MSKRFLIVCLSLGALCGAGQAHEDILVRITALDTALAEHPDATLYSRRADLFRRHHDWTKALRDYDRAAALAPDDPAIAIGRARVFLDSGAPRKALDILAPLLAATPDQSPARLLEARAFAALAETEKASASFTRALALLAPPLPEHFLEHAEALASATPPRYVEAIFALDTGLERLGDLVSLHERALALERLSGQPENALARVRRVLATAGTDLPSWRLDEAEILVTLHRLPEAREALATVFTHLENLPPRRRNTPAREALAQRAADLRESLTSVACPSAPDPGSPAP